MAEAKVSSPPAPKFVVVSSPSTLGASVKAALARDVTLQVVESDSPLDAAQQLDPDLMVVEITSAATTAVLELLKTRTRGSLVVITPPPSRQAPNPALAALLANQANIHTFDSDASVTEVLAVCQHLLHDNPLPIASAPRAAQGRMPAGLVYLARPSEPPRSVHSLPAPLLPSSHPPSSHPSGRAQAGSSPPGLAASILEGAPPFLTAPFATTEYSPELQAILRDAEQRVLSKRITSDGPGPIGASSAKASSGTESRAEVKADLRAELSWALNQGLDGQPQASFDSRSSIVAPPDTSLGTRNAGSQLPTSSGTEGDGTGVPPSVNSGTTGTAPSSSPGSPEATEAGRDAPDSTNASTARPPPPGERRRIEAAPDVDTPEDDERSPTVPPAPALPKGGWLKRALGPAASGFEDQPSVPPSGPPSGPPSPPRRDPIRDPVRDSMRAAQARRLRPASLPPPSRGAASQAEPGAQKVIAARPAAGASGPARQLTSGDSVRLCADAIRSRFTGSLTFETAEGVRRVVFLDGDFVTATSGLPLESLVAYLAEKGTLSRAVERQLGHKLPNFGRHAGAALVASGYLPQEQLWPTLRAHAEVIISRVLRLSSGTASEEGVIPERLRTEPTVFGGATGAEVFLELLRRSFEPEQALARLGGQNCRLVLGPEAKLIEECALSDDAKSDLQIALSYPLTTLLRRQQHPEFPCVLYALVELRALRVTEQGAKRRPSEKPNHDAEVDFEALRQAVLTRRALIDEGDYFAVLGVCRDATGYAIRRAYVELQRQFDPDRLFDSTKDAEFRDDLVLIREVLEEAYGIVGNAARRERYLRAIESTSPSTS